MAKYKILKTNKYTEPPYKVGDIVEGTPNSDGSIINVLRSVGQTYGFSLIDLSLVKEDVVVTPTPLSKEKEEKGLYIASSVGALAGLGFAHYRKSSVKGYIGYFILGSIVGSLFYHVIKPKSNAVTTDSSTDKDSSGASTSTSEKPMDGESAFNWLMSLLKKKNPNTPPMPDSKKQIFLNNYNSLSDIEKNAFVDVSKSLECNITSKDVNDLDVFSKCMTEKNDVVMKKYSKDVLESMSKKMNAGMSNAVK